MRVGSDYSDYSVNSSCEKHRKATKCQDLIKEVGPGEKVQQTILDVRYWRMSHNWQRRVANLDANWHFWISNPMQITIFTCRPVSSWCLVIFARVKYIKN